MIWSLEWNYVLNNREMVRTSVYMLVLGLNMNSDKNMIARCRVLINILIDIAFFPLY